MQVQVPPSDHPSYCDEKNIEKVSTFPVGYAHPDINAHSLIVLYASARHVNRQRRALARRELPKKRRRTEISVPHSGSDSAIGWHNNSLKNRLTFAYAGAISARILDVRALLAARGPLIKGFRS